jgi:hypothetical protein
MAAIGRPLLGDRLYGALASRLLEQQEQQQQQQGRQQQQDPQLAQAHQQEGQQQEQQQEQQQPAGQQRQTAPGIALDWCLPALLEPLAPLALQVGKVEVERNEVGAEVGSVWKQPRWKAAWMGCPAMKAMGCD